MMIVKHLTKKNLELIQEEEDDGRLEEDEEKADMGGKGQSVTTDE